MENCTARQSELWMVILIWFYRFLALFSVDVFTEIDRTEKVVVPQHTIDTILSYSQHSHHHHSTSPAMCNRYSPTQTNIKANQSIFVESFQEIFKTSRFLQNNFFDYFSFFPSEISKLN